MNDDQIQQIIAHAIHCLRNEQPPLDFHIVHERSTAHRLAVYLESQFRGWNIDCEYDRYGQVQKLLDGIRACDQRRRTDRILPDIIVHHRGQNGPEHNILVIEMKKHAAQDRCDFEKLQGMTDQDGTFRYQLGLYVNLNAGQFDCTWFKDGAIMPNRNA
jgi:hypothetical protein